SPGSSTVAPPIKNPSAPEAKVAELLIVAGPPTIGTVFVAPPGEVTSALAESATLVSKSIALLPPGVESPEMYTVPRPEKVWVDLLLPPASAPNTLKPRRTSQSSWLPIVALPDNPSIAPTRGSLSGASNRPPSYSGSQKPTTPAVPVRVKEYDTSTTVLA